MSFGILQQLDRYHQHLMVRRFWIWTLFLVFAYLQYWLWFSRHGILYVWNLEDSIAEYTKLNKKEEECNRLLAEEILYFRSTPEALEERARYELDMIKPGEVFVGVDDKEPKKRPQEGIISECESLQ